MTFKSSFKLALAILIVLFSSTPARAKPIRIAIPGYNITQIAFFIARERGFFKEEGLDVELIQMTGTLANLALMSGELPFTSVPTAAMTANLRGANLRVLFTTFERPLFWLYGRPQIREVRELKSKKVGVGGLNQASYTLLREVLSNHGLEAGRDYTLIQAGDSAPRFMALTTGFIDATLMPLPWNFSAQEAGMHELVALSKADMTAPYRQHRAARGSLAQRAPNGRAVHSRDAESPPLRHRTARRRYRRVDPKSQD